MSNASLPSTSPVVLVLANIHAGEDEDDGRPGPLAEDQDGHLLALRAPAHGFDAEDGPDGLEVLDEPEHVRMAGGLAVVGLLGDGQRIHFVAR